MNLEEALSAAQGIVFPGYCLFQSKYFKEWVVAKTHSMDEAIANDPDPVKAILDAVKYVTERKKP